MAVPTEVCISASHDSLTHPVPTSAHAATVRCFTEFKGGKVGGGGPDMTVVLIGVAVVVAALVWFFVAGSGAD